MEWIGRIEWAETPTACEAFYYEDTIIHEHLGREITEGPQEELEAHIGSHRRVRQEVRTVSKDRHVVRHGLHLKVLGKARQNSINRFNQVIPVEVQQFLKTLPHWLRDLVQIVAGKSRTDLVFAHDIYVEEQEVSEVRREEWSEPWCPLVTFANSYVLTGWGAREATIETARQNYAWLYVTAVALLLLVAVSMGLGQLASPIWGYLASLAASLSLAAFVEARREGAIARQRQASVWSLTVDGTAWFGFCLGIMALSVGLTAPNWVLVGVGVLVTTVGDMRWRRLAGHSKCLS